MSSSSSPRRSGPRRSSRSASPSSIRRRSSSRTTRSNPRRPSSPSPSRPPRKRFGLNVPVNQPRFVGKFDFEDKYPLDPIYEEMGPNARVWRVNLDECEVYDNDMVTEARDGLDLLLVFAGLFSAVLTTFVAQTSQSLSNNFVAVSTSLLVEMVTLQRAQINGASIDSIPSSDITAGPSGFDVWVNALWFTSLTLSLGTALMAVLVKQWLYQYMSITSGTARDRTLIRFYRFDGLRKWHVLTIISTLPIILHVALGLFLAGLVVFLIPLNIPLACIIGFITLVIYIMYAISNILPVVYTQCPYRTPFSDILNIVIRVIQTLPSLALARIRAAFTSTVDDSTPVTTDVFRTLKEAERIAATNDEVAESLAYDALLWLYQATSNPPTKNVILQSLGCLSDDVRASLPSVIYDDLNQSIDNIVQYSADGYHSIVPGHAQRANMLMRANNLNANKKFPGIVPWKLDPNTSEWPLHDLACVVAYTSYFGVDMESKRWHSPDLLARFIKDPTSISLPRSIWRLLIELSCSFDPTAPQLPGMEDDSFLISLCQLAIQNFAREDSALTPFSGGVVITHGSVPIFSFASDLLLVHLGHHDHDPPVDVTRLFIIHDFVLSFLPPIQDDQNSQSTFLGAMHVLTDIWTQIERLLHFERPPHITGQINMPDLFQRVEIVILQHLSIDGQWERLKQTELQQWQMCYAAVLCAYAPCIQKYDTILSPECFRRVLSDLCLSLQTQVVFGYVASEVLTSVFRQLHPEVSAYCSLFCQSSFLSTRTLTSFDCCRRCLYPVVRAFVDYLTGGHASMEVVRQCMEDLCTNPERFYTVCRILAIGNGAWYLKAMEEEMLQCLLDLARIDPTHSIWKDREHYIGMELRDWASLRVRDEDLDDEEKVEDIKARMQTAIEALDKFFAPPDNNISAPLDSGARETNLPVPVEASRVSRRSRIRQFLGLGSEATASPSNVVDNFELESGWATGGHWEPAD